MPQPRSLQAALAIAALLLTLVQCEGQAVGQAAVPRSAAPATIAPTPAAPPPVSAVPGDFNGCPPEGSARSDAVRRLNLLKNRGAPPAETDIDRTVTLSALLAPGDDRARWNGAHGAEIAGFVERVLPGGQETTNCGALDLPDRDTHIELVADPNDAAPDRRVIVEVTPRWRAAMLGHGVDWSTEGLKTALEGHWVKVRGWLFFDAEHANGSANTAPANRNDWRATAWEIHPITGLDLGAHP